MTGAEQALAAELYALAPAGGEVELTQHRSGAFEVLPGRRFARSTFAGLRRARLLDGPPIFKRDRDRVYVVVHPPREEPQP